MEDFLAQQFTWFGLLLTAVSLAVLHFLLRMARRYFAASALKNKLGFRVEKIVHYLLTLYEPVAVIVLCSTFIFINPPFHGLLFLLLVFAGFSHVKNYMSGRFVLLDRSVEKGKRLKTGAVEGVISKMGTFGVHLQTGAGPYHAGYSRLLEDGYTLVSGEETGGFCHLRINVAEGEEKQLSVQRLSDLLGTAPYLDFTQKPDIRPVEEGASGIEAKFLLKDENYIHDLRKLLREWGFNCESVAGKA